MSESAEKVADPAPAPATAAASADDTVDSPDVHVTPLVKLQEVSVVTGEENEETVYES